MAQPQRNAHCSYCGTAFTPELKFPRTCGTCTNITYINPTPVAVLLLPVDEGILTIRRGIEPKRGELALPGGFMDFGESWRESCARELCEETGIVVEPKRISLWDVHSVTPGMILVFGLAPRIESTALPTFAPTNETTECVILREPQPLAFPTHTQVMGEYFARRITKS